MKFFIVFYLGVVFVFADSHVYWQQLHSNRRLTMKHTFLDQLCLPDEYLDVPIEYLLLRVTSVLTPSHLPIKREYLDTASEIRVSYTESSMLQIHLWLQIYDPQDNRMHNYYVLNNATTMTKVIPRGKSAECVDIRYMCSYLGDESSTRVEAAYTIEIYWANTN